MLRFFYILLVCNCFYGCTKKKRAPIDQSSLLLRDSISFFRKAERAKLSFQSTRPVGCSYMVLAKGQSEALLEGKCEEASHQRYHVLLQPLAEETNHHVFHIKLTSEDKSEDVYLNEDELLPQGNTFFRSIFVKNSNSFFIDHIRSKENPLLPIREGCEKTVSEVTTLYDPVFKLSGFSFASKNGSGVIPLFAYHASKSWQASLSDGVQSVDVDLPRPSSMSLLKINNIDLLEGVAEIPLIKMSDALSFEWKATAVDSSDQFLQILIRQGPLYEECLFAKESFQMQTKELKKGLFFIKINKIDSSSYTFFDKNFEAWMHTNLESWDAKGLKD